MHADLDRNPHDMKSMFNAAAKHYDLMNFLTSLRQEKFWHRATRRVVMTRPGVRVFDIAAGMGASVIEFVCVGAEVVAVDFLQGMIHEGQIRHPELDFQQADATNLKFADNSFDMVAISFGLRNVTDPDQALYEFYRVLRPGGHLVVCRLPRPTWTPFRALYRFFLGAVLPPIVHLASSGTVACDYSTKSILA